MEIKISVCGPASRYDHLLQFVHYLIPICKGIFIPFRVGGPFIQIKSSFILAGLRRSVLRVCGAHLRVIALGQHRFFRRNVAAVANRWQFGVRLADSCLFVVAKLLFLLPAAKITITLKRRKVET